MSTREKSQPGQARSDGDGTEFDVIIVGSGAAGLTAAVTAASQGLKPVIIEKSRYWGGTTAMSGGGIWIPNNPVCAAAGLEDSFVEALTYLDTIIDGSEPGSTRKHKIAFLRKGPEMVRLLQKEGIKFIASMEYPDYYPDEPGGKIGRSFNTTFFDRRRLKGLGGTLRPGMESPIPLHIGKGHYLTKALTGVKYFFKALGMTIEALGYKMTGRQMMGLGLALLGHLMHIARRYEVPLWLNTPCRRLLVENGRVVGVQVERDGRPGTVRARAVILAAGGFESNPEMREKYQGLGHRWTAASPDNTGDIIQQCMDIGADTALLEEAWWAPVTVPPGGPPEFLLWERSMPHSIIVDQNGHRYANESVSFVDFGRYLLGWNKSTGGKASPSWLIMESRHRNRYVFGTTPPRFTPRRFIETGYFTEARTVAELAEKCRIPAGNLEQTVQRFNHMARHGADEDFGRGNNVYDHFFGDPRYANPNLGPIERPPFFAVKVFPGDIGTKGGVVTDEFARVLKEGRPIPGLYAAGNCAASPMGRTYPGPGATLGPAMTFGYVAAMDAADGFTGRRREASPSKKPAETPS